jgi:hypothetical protein
VLQHVIEHAHRAEQFGRLVRPRDAGARDRPGRSASKLPVTQPHAAAVRPIKPANDIEDRRLARTVRPYDAGDLAWLRREAEVGRGLYPAEGDAHTGHFERRRLAG